MVTREFEGRPDDVSSARHFASEVLGSTHPSVSAVTIVVSELATNVVRHAHTPFAVALHDEPKWVRVEVRDGGAGWSQASGSSDPGLRLGLGIVAGLADRWGLVSDRSGTIVWAEVELGV